MLRPRESRFSFTNVETSPIAVARFFSDALSSPRSPDSIVETSASDWLNWRTVWSLSARVPMKPSSAAAEPNSSSLLLSRVWLNLLKSSMVWWNCSPWPPKFFAVVSSRSESAPVRLAPVGPSATVSWSMLE